MKKISSLASIVLLAMTLAHQARAELIVNTGAPNQLGSPLMLSNGQWLAAKFSTTQDWQITSLEGFINADTGNPAGATFTVALYGYNGTTRPDTGNELFSQQATYTADGWNGLTGLNYALGAGTYWLAFEVRSTDSLIGLMPVYTPNPLQTAWSDTNSYQAASGPAYNFGVQITAVPVPPSMLLFVSGLLAAGGLRKRKSA